jgi:hypothetical protein
MTTVITAADFVTSFGCPVDGVSDARPAFLALRNA